MTGGSRAHYARPMSELIVIAYPHSDDAERVIDTARRLEAEHLLDLEDDVYVVRDADGSLSVHGRINRPLTGGARGALWGALLGRAFGSTWIGAGVGGVAGALAGHASTAGIDTRFVRALSASVPPGSSALFALVRRTTPDKVRPAIGKFGGTFLHTSLSNEEEALLQAAFDEEHRRASALRASTHGSRPRTNRRVVRRRL